MILENPNSTELTNSTLLPIKSTDDSAIFNMIILLFILIIIYCSSISATVHWKETKNMKNYSFRYLITILFLGMAIFVVNNVGIPTVNTFNVIIFYFILVFPLIFFVINFISKTIYESNDKITIRHVVSVIMNYVALFIVNRTIFSEEIIDFESYAYWSLLGLTTSTVVRFSIASLVLLYRRRKEQRANQNTEEYPEVGSRADDLRRISTLFEAVSF